LREMLLDGGWVALFGGCGVFSAGVVGWVYRGHQAHRARWQLPGENGLKRGGLGSARERWKIVLGVRVTPSEKKKIRLPWAGRNCRCFIVRGISPRPVR